MKRFLAVAALSCVAALATACGREVEGSAAAEVPHPSTAAEVAADSAATSPAPTAAPPAPIPASTGPIAAPDAPAFAALYPGAVLDAPAVTAGGPAGPGGMATYTTDADPDAVIVFHRARAEAAGLSSAMAMNQGDARAYGAASPETGASLQVVASAIAPATTSVQISWSAGL